MRKAFMVLILTAFLSVNGFGLTEEVKLSKGDEISLNEYRVSYPSYDSGSYFEISEEESGTMNIVTQIEEERVLDGERRSFDVSDELSVEIDDVGSDNNGLYLNLSLEAPRDIFADAELESSAPRRVFVGQGGEVTVPLTLENTGVVNQSFSLSADHNSSASVSFNFQSFNVSELRVDAGEEKSISAEFDVPETVEPGTYDVEMMAEGRSTATESTVIDVRESSSREERKRIDVSSRQNYLGIKPGEEKEVSVRVRNQGSAVLDNIELNVDAPENWEVETSRTEVPALDQFESFRSIVTVSAPANAETGDKFLEVSASSDDTSTEEPERIRLTVQKQSNLRYIGLGIMALSLGGLVFVYRKLGRR